MAGDGRHEPSAPLRIEEVKKACRASGSECGQERALGSAPWLCGLALPEAAHAFLTFAEGETIEEREDRLKAGLRTPSGDGTTNQGDPFGRHGWWEAARDVMPDRAGGRKAMNPGGVGATPPRDAGQHIANRRPEVSCLPADSLTPLTRYRQCKGLWRESGGICSPQERFPQELRGGSRWRERLRERRRGRCR